ncbi:hypothetical protein Tco_0499138 [Tanacetum coccineum]
MSPRRSEGEESKYPFFEGDGSSSDEWEDYDVAGDNYEGPPVFDDDQYEEESMPIYDTDIEYVIEEEERLVGKGGFDGEEDNTKDAVVVANNICSSMIQTNLVSEPKFLFKMFSRRSKGEKSEYPFFEGDGSSSDEWRDYDMAGGDYEGPPIFDDDQYEEESMSIYDTDIEDVIDGEEDNIEDVAVVANDLCSSKIQTTMSPRRSEGEESEYPFFEGDGSSFDEWGDYGVAGDNYEGPPVFDDDQYKEEIVIGDVRKGFVDNYPNFQEDENNVSFSGVVLGVEEESMPVYDTDIEDVIGEEEDNIEYFVVVANDLCSLMIQTTINIDFKEDINTKSHELISFRKSIIIKRQGMEKRL